jgi:hypothetical protein
MAMVTRDAWNRIGQPAPGFAVMENMLVGVGGVDRVGLQPFDVVRAVNGRLVTSTPSTGSSSATSARSSTRSSGTAATSTRRPGTA